MSIPPFGGVPPKWKAGTVANSITPAGGTGIKVGINQTAPYSLLTIGGGSDASYSNPSALSVFYDNGIYVGYTPGGTFNGYYGTIVKPGEIRAQNLDLNLKADGRVVTHFSGGSDFFQLVAFSFLSDNSLVPRAGYVSSVMEIKAQWDDNTAAGEMRGLTVDQTINQSGAGNKNYTGILLKMTQTSVLGTGNKLIDLQVDGTSKWVVLPDGSTGIGTATPNTTLEVAGTSPVIRISASGAATLQFLGAYGIFANAAGHFYIDNGDVAGDLILRTGGSSEKMRILSSGNVGIGTAIPTAVLHLKAGTATASTAPIKLTSGTKLTTAEAGVHEYNGNHLLTNDNIRFPVGGVLFDHYASVNNATTAETDLYTDTLAASTLANNGDKVEASYQITCAGAVAATQEMRVYFGGTLIYDTGALSLGAITANFTFTVNIIRESSTVVRCWTEVSTDFATLFPYSKYTRVTGLTLSSTNIIKITGQAAGAGAASNQITSTAGYVEFKPGS